MAHIRRIVTRRRSFLYWSPSRNEETHYSCTALSSTTANTAPQRYYNMSSPLKNKWIRLWYGGIPCWGPMGILRPLIKCLVVGNARNSLTSTHVLNERSLLLQPCVKMNVRLQYQIRYELLSCWSIHYWIMLMVAQQHIIEVTKLD